MRVGVGGIQLDRSLEVPEGALPIPVAAHGRAAQGHVAFSAARVQLDRSEGGSLDPWVRLYRAEDAVNRQDVVGVGQPAVRGGLIGIVSIARSKCSTALSRASWLGRVQK